MTETEKTIINSYSNYMSRNKISKTYNIAQSYINKVLKKYNVPYISSCKRNNPDILENYFENIDTPNKAYWIGWILTDGSVSTKRRYNLKISLQNRDKYILEIFQNDLKIKNHVYTSKYKSQQKEYANFDLDCKKIVTDLSKYGIVDNKTKILKFPNNIKSNLFNHLLRGFTVGYATRFIKERGKSYTNPYIEFSFTGTYDMCEGFQNIIVNNVGIEKKNITKNNNMFHVRWSNRKEILKICEYLYLNKSDHYLTRKYDKYMYILNSFNDMRKKI